MYKLLLVLASAQALKRRRALAVRGGEIDPITIGKGVSRRRASMAHSIPRQAPVYGIKAEDKGNAMMRLAGWSQILFAAALNLDTESVHGQRVQCINQIVASEHTVICAQDGVPLDRVPPHRSAFLEKFQCPRRPTPSGWRSVPPLATRPSTAPSQMGRDGPLAHERCAVLARPQGAVDLYEMKGTNRLCKAMTSMMGDMHASAPTSRRLSWTGR